MTNSLKEGRTAFIGCGKMGEAMLSGWLSSEAASTKALSARGFDVILPEPDRAAELESLYKVRSFLSAKETPSDASLVVLAVKPQVMDEVLPELAASPVFANSLPLVVSIAAGITTDRLQNALPDGTHVVRVMPNMPLQVREGASVVAGGTNATSDEVEFVNGLFAALGTSQIVEEDMIDVACALSGGGPAYFAYLAECLVSAAVEAGLPEGLAETLARQTLAGTGVCLAEGEDSLAELRKSVCSPGGTTLAALDKMCSYGLADVADAGVHSAIQRAKELAAC